MKAKKSKSLRKKFVKLPSGKTTIHYESRKAKAKTCRECGSSLHGIPKLTATKFSKLPKTKKRPQRPYGGVLCSKCSKNVLVEKIRNEK